MGAADERVSQDLKQKIMKARAAKGMNQQQLATKCGVKKDIIASYESGKAIPNPQMLNKMSRVLGVALSNKPAKKKKKK